MRLKRVRRVEEIPVSSMADIAFLLIIFFMLTSLFSLKESLSLVLPGLEGEKRVVFEEDLLTIQVDEEGEVSIDGRKVRLGEVKDLVKRRAKERKDLFVLFKIHPKCGYGVVVDILDELRRAGLYDLSLKVTE